jgi:hypothetical protein
VTVHDLSGTSVEGVEVDLASLVGGQSGDGQADRVIVDGTATADTIAVSGGAGGIAVSGLAATVSVSHAESFDQLVVNGLGGVDAITSSGVDGLILLTINQD